MKILYMGTAAAEGFPAAFCNCDACKRAINEGGKNIRTRSQIAIDEDVLIDFPMDTYMHKLRYSRDLSAVRDVFITHSHMDHCYVEELCMHGAPYSDNMTRKTITIHSNQTVLDDFHKKTAREMRDNVRATIGLHLQQPYEKTPIDGGFVMAIPAKHTVGEMCFVYAVCRNGANALFLGDSGILDIAVYERVKQEIGHLDLISFDCTYGDFEKGAGRHMGLVDNHKQLLLMKSVGLCDDSARTVCTHFSHNSHLTHDEINERCARYNMIAAYDGMEIVL